MNIEVSKQSSVSVNRLSQLQASIKSMKTRIQSLLKFQNANQRQIKQTLKSSVHHLGHKIAQTEYSQSLRKTKQNDKLRIKQQHKEITQFRQKHNEQLQRIKQTMKQMKKNQSQIIKKQSRLNDGIIRQNRRKNIQSKKDNVQKMKQIKEENKRVLAQRWIQNNESMLQTRRNLMKQNKVKEELILQNKVKQLQRIQKQLSQKVQQSNQTTKTLQLVAKDTYNVSKIQFYKMIKQVKKQKKINNQNDLKNQIYQKFLSSRMGQTMKERSTHKNYSNNQSTFIQRSDREDVVKSKILSSIQIVDKQNQNQNKDKDYKEQLIVNQLQTKQIQKIEHHQERSKEESPNQQQNQNNIQQTNQIKSNTLITSIQQQQPKDQKQHLDIHNKQQSYQKVQNRLNQQTNKQTNQINTHQQQKKS